MGGGGSSGKIEFPQYIEDQHRLWLTLEGPSNSDVAENTPILSVAGYLHLGRNPEDPDITPLLFKYNPYGDHSDNYPELSNPQDFSDPAADLAATQARFDSYATIIDSFDPETTFASLLQKAATEVGVAGRLNSLAASTLATTARSDATGVMGELVKDTGILETTDWESFMSSIKSKLAESGVLTSTDFTAVESAARTGSTAAVTAALSAAIGNTGLAERTDWGNFVDDIVAKLKICGVLKNIDIPALFNMAMSQATNEVERAIETASDALDNKLLAAVVDGYDQRISYSKAKSLANFNSLMSDANAVHGSAHLIGTALIYAQYQADLDRFDAELSLNTYQRSLELHGTAISAFFTISLQAASENIRNRTQLFISSLDSMVGILANRSSFETSLTNLYGGTYGQQLDGGSRSDITDKAGRDSIMRDAFRAMAGMLGSRAEYEASLSRLHGQLFVDSFGRHLQAATSEKQARDTVMNTGMRGMEGLTTQRLSLLNAATARQAEINRLSIVATAEYEAANRDNEAKFRLWPITIFERASNVLAAPAGMAATIPTGPSRVASALGGALSGAGAGALTGAQIGAAGGPIGATAGAGIGAVIGLTAGIIG